MTLFDSNGNIITNPNLKLGYITPLDINCYHNWIVDVPVEFEEIIIAEYPNGGKEIKKQIKTPEQGHWITTDESGKELPYDGSYYDDWKETAPIPDVWNCQLYVQYTADELSEIKEQERLAAEQEAKIEAQQEFLEKAPERVEAIEFGVDDNYEATAELGVLLDEQGLTIDDILNAVAELGTMVDGSK